VEGEPAQVAGFQSVVISLKDQFYDKADALVGCTATPRKGEGRYALPFPAPRGPFPSLQDTHFLSLSRGVPCGLGPIRAGRFPKTLVVP